jgi:hypothetical protein
MFAGFYKLLCRKMLFTQSIYRTEFCMQKTVEATLQDLYIGGSGSGRIGDNSIGENCGEGALARGGMTKWMGLLEFGDSQGGDAYDNILTRGIGGSKGGEVGDTGAFSHLAAGKGRELAGFYRKLLEITSRRGG